MSIKTIAVAAVAAFGLSVAGYSASAGAVNEGASLSSAKTPGAFTLMRSMGGVGSHMGAMGGPHMGAMGAGHFGGMRGGMSLGALATSVPDSIGAFMAAARLSIALEAEACMPDAVSKAGRPSGTATAVIGAMATFSRSSA